MVPEAVRTYLLHDLSATPGLIKALLGGSVDWDGRPHADRFTLREMIAHLADWESVWFERVRRIESEDSPFLPSIDESNVATVGNYAGRDPYESMQTFVQGRRELTSYIETLSAEVWLRPAHREFVGDIDFLQLIAMIAGHDGYHLKQVCEYTS